MKKNGIKTKARIITAGIRKNKFNFINKVDKPAITRNTIGIIKKEKPVDFKMSNFALLILLRCAKCSSLFFKIMCLNFLS